MTHAERSATQNCGWISEVGDSFAGHDFPVDSTANPGEIEIEFMAHYREEFFLLVRTYSITASTLLRLTDGLILDGVSAIVSAAIRCEFVAYYSGMEPGTSATISVTV